MKLKDVIVFAGLSLAWGSSFFWIKIALEEIKPFLLVAFRLLFGIVGLAIYASIVRPTWPREGRVWVNLFILGMINTALPFTLISWGEQSIDSGIASILNASVPMFTAVIAHMMLKDDKLSLVRGVGILLGFAGVLLVISRGSAEQVESNLLGQAAVLLAAISYAAAAVFSRSKAKKIPPLVQSLGTLVMADSVLWMGVGMVESPVRLPELPLTWGALLWLGLIGSFVAYLFYYYLIQSIGPTRASMVTFMFPVVALFLGIVFLGEVLDWQLVAGGGLVISSLLIVNFNLDLNRLTRIIFGQRKNKVGEGNTQP